MIAGTSMADLLPKLLSQPGAFDSASPSGQLLDHTRDDMALPDFDQIMALRVPGEFFRRQYTDWG
jgi:hypothetical protein